MVASAEKASLMGSQFDSAQCREQFVALLPCFPQFRCISLAFHTPVLLSLLLDLDTYGGVDPLHVSSLPKDSCGYYFSKTVHNFSWLVRWGLFPECLRYANVTAIPKGAPSPDIENYRPISITHFLCKVYEKLISHQLFIFSEKSGFLPAAQFAYRKGLGCTDALLTISHHLQKSLDAGIESYIFQLNFSSALDRVSHRGLLFKL